MSWRRVLKYFPLWNLFVQTFARATSVHYPLEMEANTSSETRRTETKRSHLSMRRKIIVSLSFRIILGIPQVDYVLLRCLGVSIRWVASINWGLSTHMAFRTPERWSPIQWIQFKGCQSDCFIKIPCVNRSSSQRCPEWHIRFTMIILFRSYSLIINKYPFSLPDALELKHVRVAVVMDSFRGKLPLHCDIPSHRMMIKLKWKSLWDNSMSRTYPSDQ